MSKKQNEKTWMQDWTDSFPYLHESRGAPFTMILSYARSLRKLNKMLKEWLPAHWWLSPSERQELGQFWERWYLEGLDLRKPWLAEWIMRDHVVCVCDDLGLREHYLDRILPESSPGHTAGRFGFEHKARAVDMHKVVYDSLGEESGKTDCLPVLISGQKVKLVCFRTNGEYGEPEWYVCIYLDDRVPLIEPVVHTLSQCRVKLLYESGNLSDQVVIVFNSNPMDQLVTSAKGKDHGWWPWDILFPQKGFLQALSKELKAQGLRDFTIPDLIV